MGNKATDHAPASSTTYWPARSPRFSGFHSGLQSLRTKRPTRAQLMTTLRALEAILFGAWVCCTTASADGWQHIGVVERVTPLQEGVELSAGPAKVRISIFRPGVVRIRLAPDGVFPKDLSWAVVESPEPPWFKLEDAPNELSLTTENVVVRV